MHYSDSDKAQAIVFFGESGVSKELLYPEFEAILDGFAPLSEFADSSHKAAYVEFNADFNLTAAVFFLIGFDESGAIEASWNLPLMDMARTAATGPDLGAGPIHLACQSQTPVAYFHDWLWDPDMKPATSHFVQIKKALKRNRLGLSFKKKQDETADVKGSLSAVDAKKMEQRLSQQFSKQYEKEFRDQMAQLLKEQRLRISTMTNEKDLEVKQLRLDHIKKLETLQQEAEEKQALITDLEKRNVELKATIDGQVQKIEGLREYFEHKLERLQGSDGQAIESLKEQYKTEVEAKVALATRELNDLLKMKDLELSYHSEHAAELNSEIQQLRKSNQELLTNNGDHVLENLSRKGVNFVTYQPGAGHITIPYSDLHKFLENPNAFTAAYCGVSEKHYQAWLKHYQTPVCCAVNEIGEMCCNDLKRVANPEQFIPGESDLCEQHLNR